MPRYQWVKFKEEADFKSTDIEPLKWVLVELWETAENGGVFMFGLDYEMAVSDVAVFGPTVDVPRD